MTSIKAFLQRHSLLCYFVLVFAITWGGLLLAVGPGQIPGTPKQIEARLPLMVLAVLAGPSLSGLAMTALVEGSGGLRELRSRLGRWRVAARWYLVALLTAPILFVAILLALSFTSPVFLPGIFAAEDKAAFLQFGIVVGLSAGFFEEIGWTGFALPRLRRSRGVLATGLILGLLWALWHELPGLWLSGAVSGPFSRISYLLDPFLYLVAYRVLMVWVYERTGSLLLAMAMHASLTGSARILSPQAIAGAPLMMFDLIWAAVLWLVILVLAVANRGELRQRPLRSRMST